MVPAALCCASLLRGRGQERANVSAPDSLRCVLQSVAEATQQEIEKIDMEPIELDAESQAGASKPARYPDTLMRTIAAVGAIAAAVTLVAITPIGPWLADEFAIVGATVAKVSALLKAIMERIPWPQPMHGEQGLWETITILFTSVIVRPLSAAHVHVHAGVPQRALSAPRYA